MAVDAMYVYVRKFKRASSYSLSRHECTPVCHTKKMCLKPATE